MQSPPRFQTPEKLLDENEVAECYGLSVRTLQAWRVKGGGPAFCKLGSRVRYRPTDLEAFVTARVLSDTSEPAR